MAVPSMALGNIYEAGDCVEDTESIMYGALCAQRMMKAAVLRQKVKLIELRVKLTADIRDGPTLPYATQIERLRRSQHIDSLICWLEQTEETIDNAIRVLRNPPRLPGLSKDNEQTATEGA